MRGSILVLVAVLLRGVPAAAYPLRVTDEHRYLRGIDAERAGFALAAADWYAELRRTSPASKFAMDALAREAAIYQKVGMLADAAPLLEEYAMRYAGERDAYDAMIAAIHVRTVLGDNAKAIADTTYLIKTFGAKRPIDVAEAAFALTAIYERQGDAEITIKHLRQYIRMHGQRGGFDRLVIAHAKIGQLQWQRSCRARQIDGLCARVARRKRTQCGAASSADELVVVQRDSRMEKAALAAFATAIKVFETTSGQVGGDEAGARSFYAAARLALIDADLEAVLESTDIKEAAFDTWLADETKRREKLMQGYQRVLEIRDMAGSLVAASRMGLITDTLAQTLGRSRAHCSSAEPLRAAAISAYGVCLAKAIELGWFDDTTRSCERSLLRLAPEHYPPLREHVGAPSNSASVIAVSDP